MESENVSFDCLKITISFGNLIFEKYFLKERLSGSKEGV